MTFVCRGGQALRGSLPITILAYGRAVMNEAITRRDMLKTVGAAAGGIAALSAAIEAAEPQAPSAVEAGPAEYTLPPLPYGYDALEPIIDAQTLKLHHDMHHAGYVRGLNAAMGKLAEAAKAGETAMVKYWMADAAFNGAGHVLHSLYWTNLAPGGGKLDGPVARMAARDFGSTEAFLAQFTAITGSVPGSGWGLLSYEPVGRRLIITGVQKHEDVYVAGAAPLLVVDVWEHAYYLKYQNRRGEYVDAVVKNLIDWSAVNKRLEAAMMKMA